LHRIHDAVPLGLRSLLPQHLHDGMAKIATAQQLRAALAGRQLRVGRRRKGRLAVGSASGKREEENGDQNTGERIV